MGKEVDYGCPNCGEHESRIQRNEGDIQKIWDAIERMKTAVIVGSFSMILSLVGVVGNFVHTAMSKPEQKIIVVSPDGLEQKIRVLNR